MARSGGCHYFFRSSLKLDLAFICYSACCVLPDEACFKLYFIQADSNNCYCGFMPFSGGQLSL